MGFEFGAVAAFAVMAVTFAFGAITLGQIAGPKLPSPQKSIIYECGELPIGSAWFNFNPRFYLIALVFVIFEVELALTFPVVAVYKRWIAMSPTMGLVALVEATDAMAKAGSADPAKYLPVLAKTSGYKGVTGNIGFDEKGDIKNGALTLFTYKGGKREQIAVVR